MEPVVACTWSCDLMARRDHPARYLFHLLVDHGIAWHCSFPVAHRQRRPWSYVERIGAAVPEVRLGTKVTSVLETADGVEVTDGSGAVATYDAVVVATHPGQAFSMLAEPTALQREVLTAMPYSPNTALLHTDASVMPAARDAWASWNFRRVGEAVERPTDDGVVVTYDLRCCSRKGEGAMPTLATTTESARESAAAC